MHLSETQGLSRPMSRLLICILVSNRTMHCAGGGSLCSDCAGGCSSAFATYLHAMGGGAQ